MNPRVCIVVLNWNGSDDTKRCLTSLSRLTYRNFDTLVVDNDSTDDSVADIRQAFPNVTVMQMDENLGFAGGCNVGIRAALSLGADYVWLLNNDTTVDAGALDALIAKAAANPRLGAVGSAIYVMDQPDRLEAWGGGRINFWLGRSRHIVKAGDDDKVEFITGASLLIPRAAVEQVGLLDDDFFMYWEDADYCFRLRKAGWRLGVAGDSRVWHKGSASVGLKSAKMDTYFNNSAVRFFDKHAYLPAVPLWTGVGMRLAKRILTGDWVRVRAVWSGVNGD